MSPTPSEKHVQSTDRRSTSEIDDVYDVVEVTLEPESESDSESSAHTSELGSVRSSSEVQAASTTGHENGLDDDKGTRSKINAVISSRSPSLGSSIGFAEIPEDDGVGRNGKLNDTTLGIGELGDADSDTVLDDLPAPAGNLEMGEMDPLSPGDSASQATEDDFDNPEQGPRNVVLKKKNYIEDDQDDSGEKKQEADQGKEEIQTPSVSSSGGSNQGSDIHSEVEDQGPVGLVDTEVIELEETAIPVPAVVTVINETAPIQDEAAAGEEAKSDIQQESSPQLPILTDEVFDVEETVIPDLPTIIDDVDFPASAAVEDEEQVEVAEEIESDDANSQAALLKKPKKVRGWTRKHVSRKPKDDSRKTEPEVSESTHRKDQGGKKSRQQKKDLEGSKSKRDHPERTRRVDATSSRVGSSSKPSSSSSGPSDGFIKALFGERGEGRVNIGVTALGALSVKKADENTGTGHYSSRRLLESQRKVDRR